MSTILKMIFGTKLGISVILAVAAAGWGGWKHFSTVNELKSDLVTATSEASRLTTENASLATINNQLAMQVNTLEQANQDVVTAYKEFAAETAVMLERYETELSGLAEKYQQARDDSNKLREVLAKHDLEYLASQKPGLIESRINAATKRVFSDIKDATAGPSSPDVSGTGDGGDSGGGENSGVPEVPETGADTDAPG